MNTLQKHASELMPTDEKALSLLEARAALLAKQEADAKENNGIAYIRFKLSPKEYYGIAYQYVQEILHHATVSKPPFLPHFVSGVINWRGKLITVVELGKFFHPAHSEDNLQSQFIIVIHVNPITLGLLVNQIEGSDIYHPNQLGIPLSAVNVANPEYILGLHQAITAIIHIEALLPELSQEIKKSIYRIGEVHGNCD